MTDELPTTETESYNHVAQSLSHPRQIGKFKILDVLGEGGMGVVYLAQQEKPIRRKVALKLIKLGMDTKQVIARFESERQALAMMNHPNLASVLDAGMTDEGRPYFVMEYVPGIPITEYCDKHRLSTKERLVLFIDLCEAVQHAHQKGIIHRDLKPSNVLVSVQDDRAAPKIIDFGVAKATRQRLSEKTVFTEQGQCIGTPEYMSPEQAEMTALDVDTRTDIYSLGVLLYELMIGKLPFDSASLRQAGYAQMQQLIRDQEPPKPSTRLISLRASSTQSTATTESAAGSVSGLSTDNSKRHESGDHALTGTSGPPNDRESRYLGNVIEEIARCRRIDVHSLIRHLRGDLDWIIMKAMDKDRTRRYPSASDFAADIRRHLVFEPVLASPPNAIYRLKKFARRNRGKVAAGGLIFTALAIGIVFSVAFAVQASRAKDEAKAQAVELAAVNKFLLEDMLGAASPDMGLGKDATLRHVMDKAARRIEAIQEPRVAVSVQLAIGRVYLALEEFDAARHFIERAFSISRRELPAQDVLLGDCHFARGWLLKYNDENDLAALELDQALSIYRERSVTSPNKVADTLFQLGVVSMKMGDLPRSESLLNDALGIYEKRGGREDRGVADCLMILGDVERERNRLDAATDLYKQALEIRKAILGPGHSDTVMAQVRIGFLAEHGGEQLLQQALASLRKQLDPDHTEIAYVLTNIGVYRFQKNDPAGAIDPLRDALAIYTSRLADHRYTSRTRYCLARALIATSQYEEAAEHLEAVIAFYERDPDHAGRILAMANLQLGICKMELNHDIEAERHLVEAEEWLETAVQLPEEHKRALEALLELYQRLDRREKIEIYKEKLSLLHSRAP